MTLHALAAALRPWYAATFPHRCTIEAPRGTGASAGYTPVATGVPCWFVAASAQDWTLAPGAEVGKTLYTVRFPAGQDVQDGYRLTRTDVRTGERPLVRGVKPAGADMPALLALAEWRA